MNENIKNCLIKIRYLFLTSFITLYNELVLDRKYNIYFLLDDIETEEDFNCKMIAWLSRPAHKGLTKKEHEKFRKRLNSYFNTDWGNDDIALIYTYLGNDINRELCRKFIQSKFNLDVLREYERSKYGKKIS